MFENHWSILFCLQFLLQTVHDFTGVELGQVYTVSLTSSFDEDFVVCDAKRISISFILAVGEINLCLCQCLLELRVC